MKILNAFLISSILPTYPFLLTFLNITFLTVSGDLYKSPFLVTYILIPHSLHLSYVQIFCRGLCFETLLNYIFAS
jgi:hypothetical protein